MGCYGDGGAIFTNDDAIAQACRVIRVHGQSKRYVHTRIGAGGRMDTLQCIVMLAKLARFNWEREQRIAAGNRYLGQPAGHCFNESACCARGSKQCLGAIHRSDRDLMLTKLNADRIPNAAHYPVPLQQQPAYQNLCRISGALENADTVARWVVNLPMHPYIGVDTQKAIVRSLSEAVV